jgi:hypothetical protein
LNTALSTRKSEGQRIAATHRRFAIELARALDAGGGFSQDGKRMFVAVGSGSNVDDPDRVAA